MEPFLGRDGFGNPSSLHSEGQRAKRALDEARAVVAESIGAQFSEINFNSGGTEADNAALFGVTLANRRRGEHFVTTQIEHEAVLHTARFLETIGFEATYLAPDAQGLVTASQVLEAIRTTTTLVSVMHANNEIGTVQPIAEIGGALRGHNTYFHSDAVQTYGVYPLNVHELGVDLLTVSAHKIYGPKGVGALYVRDGIPIEPLLHGGGQERERRAGTENVAAIAGFGEAVRLMLIERETTAKQMERQRDLLIGMIRERIPGAALNGHQAQRLPGNVHFSFPDIDAESLLVSLDLTGVAASSGSACTAGSIEPSHVLTAIGAASEARGAALRLTLGRETTDEEIRETVEILTRLITRLTRV
ncbi:cysteine desulfurase IscS [Capsulimonas corticalis]|uniref:cysteine desulfurase n=2 Tax=Capsulimonas corticalis TaxID=2219043 RepID=A0A402CXH3_9BACT|nr:cysteine desulfurase IscS [Capsulimonas corticalis]